MNSSQKNPRNSKQGRENPASYDHQILNTSSIGVLITRISDGTILYANKAIANLLEVADADSLLGKPTPNFYWDPRDRQAILERFRAEGSATENELRTRRVDGSMAWISISLQPFNLEGEDVLLSEVVDITSRKQAEEALRESQSLYRSLVEVSPLSVCRKDLDGRFTFANQRFLEASHVTLSDIIGKTDVDLHPSEFAEKYRRDDLDIMESGQAKEIIEERPVHEGKVSIVQTIKAPIYDGNGKVNGIQISFWDITDRKLAEEARQESEERFRSLYNNATIGLYRTTPEGQILMINPTGLRLLGFDTFEEMAKRNLEQSGFEEVDARKKFRERLEREGIIEQESIWTKKDGTPIFVRESSTVSRDEKGNVLYYDGSFEDITARKQAEEALHTSEQRYQTIFNASPVMFWLKDAKNNMIQINQAAAAFEHVKPEDIQGRSSYDVYPREQAEAFYQDDLAVMRSGKPKLGIVEKHTAPGTGASTWVETGKVPILDDKGEATGVLAFGVDITDRQQTEEALRTSEERFKRFTEATVEGLVFHEQGKIIDANPAILSIFGVSDREGFIGGNILDFIAPESHNLVMKQMQLESVLPYEILGIRRDGTTFPIETSTRAYHDGERIIRASSIRDITERKQAEKALQQSETNLISALRVAQMGHWEFDIATQMFILNDQYYSLHGLTAQDVGGYQVSVQRFAQEFVHPEDAAIVGQASQQAIETTDPNFQVQIEARILRKGGEIRWANVWFGIEKDEHGRTTKFHGVSQDITERKQAEKELQSSREQFSNIIDFLPDATFVTDRERRVISWNRAIEEMTGVKKEDIVGKGDFAYSVPFYGEARPMLIDSALDQSQISDRYASVQKQSNRLSAETYVPSVYNGRGAYLFVTTSPLYDSNGTITGAIESIRDITENKKLESEIQAAFERRGYQVQVSTDISQEVASTTELSDLFSRVVTLTKERLGYYHTQLLRYDANRDAVVLINGYGEIGQKMLAGGHQMPMGEGLIGTAATSGETVLRPTLADDPDWHPNPLLPDTQGEIAVPIKWQNTVLGVLDVQSNQAGALTDDDRLLFEGLCGQIAIAMHNAELVEAVRQNEANLAEALRAARLANWEYDVEKDLFTFNDEFYSIFHTTAEKAGGYQISSARYAEIFVHPDDMELVGTEIGKALSSTDRVYNTTLDHRILYEDGGVGYITVKVTVERDENGKITRYYGANQDITERKQAEEALRVNEARLAEALLAARLANWEYDVEKDIFTFNDQFYSIFHTTVEKAGGYQLSSARYAELFVHPDDMEIVGIEIGKALSSTDRVYNTTIDHRIKYEDGGVGYITVQLTVERDENGKITRYYGANQDITERKQAETALRESELRYQQILDAITDMILVKGQKSSIVWANKAFREYYGMTNEQLHDMIDAPIVEPDYTLQYIKDDVQVFESGEVLLIPEEPVTRYDGTVHPFETFKAPIRDLNGNVIMTVGVSRDITERKKEQEALAERLEEINRLYQNLSHEGWKTYRETSNLPKGYMFDQTGVQPVEDMALASESFSQVPMKVLGGEVVGTLSVANDPRNPTSLEDLVFLQQVSDQVALALEGARLSAQTQSALAQSEILFESSRRLAQVSDLQELLKTAIETFNIPIINGAELDMFNYDSEGELESLSVVANWWNGIGIKPGEIGSRFPKAMFSAIKLFLTTTPVSISDALDSERVDASMLRIVKTFNIRAVTFLPLFVGTHQIGVLVMHAEEPHNFTEEETRLFSGLAPQIATVLENRRQFERAQQQAEREGMLNIISQKIQSATSVEAVLQIAARELGHALGAPMTIAQLSMKDKK